MQSAGSEKPFWLNATTKQPKPVMKNFYRTLALVGVGGSLLIGAANVQAQNRGNFDPAQFQQQMLERMRTSFDVTDDAEWKLISDRISKVTEARRATTTGGFGGFGGGGPGGPGGGGRPPGGDNAAAPSDNGGKGNRTRGGGQGGPGGGGPGGRTASPEQDALQKAIEAKASNDEIKAKLERLRESRHAAEAKLEKAQQDLREVLSVRQEAVAVMFGLLK